MDSKFQSENIGTETNFPDLGVEKERNIKVHIKYFTIKGVTELS
jgi:hypothetical protein